MGSAGQTTSGGSQWVQQDRSIQDTHSGLSRTIHLRRHTGVQQDRSLQEAQSGFSRTDHFSRSQGFNRTGRFRVHKGR